VDTDTKLHSDLKANPDFALAPPALRQKSRHRRNEPSITYGLNR
jgi:hypothetical protein